MKTFINFIERLLLITVLVLTVSILAACSAEGTEGGFDLAVLWLSVQHFFTGFTWDVLVKYLIFFVFGVVIALDPKWNFFQWIKITFNVADQKANVLVWVAAVLITLPAMLVTNAIDLTSFDLTLASVIALGQFVWQGSQFAYQRLKEMEDEGEIVLARASKHPS